MNHSEYYRRLAAWERANPLANAQEHLEAMKSIMAQLDVEYNEERKEE